MKADKFKLEFTRLATLNDTQEIADMALALSRTTSYSKLPVDRDKTVRVVEGTIMNSPKQTLMLVSVDDSGRPVGFLAGMPYDVVFSSEPMAMEIGWYVDPESPKWKKRYLELRAAFEEWARRMGYRYAQYGILNPTEKDFHNLTRNKNAEILELIFHRDITQEE